MNFLKKIFGFKKNETFLKKTSINADDIMNKTVIVDYNDLFTRKYDLIIFKAFFKKDEIKHIKNVLYGDLSKKITQIDNRYRAIPPVFECLTEKNKDIYFNNCEKDMVKLNTALGYDIRHKYYEFFKELAQNNESIKTPYGITIEEKFQPGSFRIIPTDYGEIKIHADNNFYPKNSLMFEHIKKQVNLNNHISYITLIQKPEKGGNLVIHNIEQSEYRTINSNNEVINNETGKAVSVNKFLKDEIIIEEGDLVMFSGGQLWHSVNKLEGSIERITHGGFSSYSFDKKSIYLWT